METAKILNHAKILPGLAVALLILCLSGCTTIIGYDGTRIGKVVDRDTGQPIEGAVVHGTWNRVHIGPGGAHGVYYDSRETLAGKDGSFKLDGIGLLILSTIDDVEINVFKAGYTQLAYAFWHNITDYKTKDVTVELVDDTPVIKLRRMTMEERKLWHPVLPGGDVPKKHKRLLIRESNEEMKARGYSSKYLSDEE